MIRTTFGALALLATLPLATPAAAQSAQERLDSRYDRALAAGYKALFLCSAIANAERNGATRTPESVHEWELTGIQAPLDNIVRDMPYEILRGSAGQISQVRVEWAEEMPDRVAINVPDNGCSTIPIGTSDEGSVSENQLFDVENTKEEYEDFAIWVRTYHSLERVVNRAISGTDYGDDARTTAILILDSGHYGVSRYAEGFDENTPQRTWSVAKSIASTLVGAAVLRGEADVNASAGLGASDEDPRRSITVDHALRMATGRYSDTAGNRTDPLYWGGTTVDERAQNWPLVYAPGTIYRYANNDTLAAVKAIEETFEAHPPAEFFAKLGMDHTIAETDWQGNYVLSSQAWTTARDLAKLGQLYLNNGMWNGERVLPENWREYVSTPSGPQPEGTDWGYGAGWWTFRRPEGNAFEGIPNDAFAARGNRGQYLVVVPSRNVVIVRRGEDMVGTRFDIAAFTRDVLAALEE